MRGKSKKPKLSWGATSNNEPTEEELKDHFKGFKVKDVFVDYDFPRVFSASNEKGKTWLFKWCDRLNEKNNVDAWLAFEISEHRLESMRDGTLSLLEAISLAKGNLYLYLADTPFEPKEVKIQGYDSLDSSYLPRKAIPFTDDREPDITMRGSKQFGVKLHILTDVGQPLKLVSFPISFQEFLSTTGHNLERTGQHPNFPTTDWSMLDVTNLSPRGSIVLECVVSNPKKEKILSSACELLARLLSEKPDLKVIREQMGEDGFMWATSLLKFVKVFDVSLSIRWVSETTPNGFIPFDARRAKRALDLLDAVAAAETRAERRGEAPMPEATTTVTIDISEGQLRPVVRLRLKLTPEEAEPIRRPAVGPGGMQTLLRELQSQDVLLTDNTITLTQLQVERVIRYTSVYGQGGFQGRLLGLAMALKRVGISLSGVSLGGA